MGRRNDSMAVIDSQARVIGVHNLRVVDASSFPLLPPGHPTSTICKLQRRSLSLEITQTRIDLEIDALAEKIADNILTGN
jgi:choline dehydrogenase